jgi:hypothetical protein
MKIFSDAELPESLTPLEIEALVDYFLSQSPTRSETEIYEAVDLLCDKQWHTYTEPTQNLKDKMARWLRLNWNDCDLFREVAMNVCYSFALPTTIYENALRDYHGESRLEYDETLAKSTGDNINPYYSLQ